MSDEGHAPGQDAPQGSADPGGPRSAVGPFSGSPAGELIDELLQDPVTGGGAGTTASEVLTAALRAVNETGDVLDTVEGWRGIAAVALLLSEAAPSVLDGAPRSDELRQYLARWDTELTPARRTLCSAVLRRLGLQAENEWFAVVTRQAGEGGPALVLTPLEEVLADS